MLMAKMDVETLKPVAIIKYVVFDETPMKVANKQRRELLRPTINRSSNVAELSKIQNTEFKLSLLLWDPQRKKHIMVHSEIACPLKLGDRSTGEVVKRQIEDQQQIPLLDSFCDKFPIVVEAATRDRGAGNLRALGAGVLERPANWFFGQSCMIHCISTVFGKALGLISDTVSGGIAMGIAQRPAGSIQHFKSAVEQVLSDSVVVVPGGIPPNDGADVIRYRAAVLDTWQSGRPGLSGARRRVMLESRCRDDWQSDELRMYVPEDADDDAVQALKASWVKACIAVFVVCSHS